MRQLIERLELYCESGFADSILKQRGVGRKDDRKPGDSDMDAKGFETALRSAVQLGSDSSLAIDPYNKFSQAHDEVSVTYYGVPENASQVEKMNSRASWDIGGFSKELGKGPPGGKVTLAMSIAWRKYKTRGKSGTPEQIVKYLAAEIKKIEEMKKQGVA